MRNTSKLMVGLAVLAACLSTAGAADEVAEIRVEGNKAMTDDAVLASTRIRVGQPYDESVVQADTKRLLETKRFQSVEAVMGRTEAGVVVTFRVEERPLVARILILGNRAFATSDLLAALPFGEGDPLSVAAVRRGRDALATKYQDAGYFSVSVAFDEEALARRLEVIYTIREGERAVVREINFEGNSFFSSITLRQRIGTSIRRWPFITGELDMQQLDQDVQILRKLYVEEGFLAVEVDRLPPEFSDDKKKVSITFVIREGPRFAMGVAIFEGNTVFSDEQLALRLVLEPGAYFTPVKLERDLEAIRATYGEMGYIEVGVTARRIYKEDQGVVDVEFTIVENDQYVVGQIEIRGNTVTESRVIRRELTFFPEQRFDTTAVKRSEHALRETQLFEQVRITPVPAGEGVRNAVVEVSEARTAQFLVGAGVSTDSGLIGNISLTERNFNLYRWPTSFEELFSGTAWKGGGQTLRLSAEPGTELMRFHIEWREPMLFDRPYSLGVRAFLFDRGRENYDETRYGGLVSLGHRFKNDWYGETAVRIEGVEVADLSTDAPPEVIADQGTHLLVGLKGTLIRDRTDSRWSPSTGDRFHVSYEQVTGDYDFGRIDTGYNWYRTLYIDALDRKHVFRTRVALGYICGDAPVFEKYYGGGSSWLRGFEYRGITPRSAGTDEPIGGDFSLFAGAEYEFPVVGEELRGVVFLDTGTIEEDFEVTTYRASVGVGLRWFVPLFGPVPVHLDLGVPLIKDDDDDEQIFSFTIGWTF